MLPSPSRSTSPHARPSSPHANSAAHGAAPHAHGAAPHGAARGAAHGAASHGAASATARSAALFACLAALLAGGAGGAGLTACGASRAPRSPGAPEPGAAAGPAGSASVAPAAVASARNAVAVAPETPCERAARWVARARALHDEGWIHRPLTLLARAREVCPNAGDTAVELDALLALGRHDEALKLAGTVDLRTASAELRAAVERASRAAPQGAAPQGAAPEGRAAPHGAVPLGSAPGGRAAPQGAAPLGSALGGIRAGGIGAMERGMADARARGDRREERRLQARWIAELEADTQRSPVLWPRPRGGRILHVAPNGAEVLYLARGDDAAASSGVSTVTVIDGPTGLPAQVFEVSDAVAFADATPGRLLVGTGPRLYLIERASGAVGAPLGWTEETYTWAAFCDQGRRVVAVGEAGFHAVLRVYDAVTGKSLGELGTGAFRAPSQAALLDERRLVVPGDNELLVVDLMNVKISARLALPPPPPPPPPRRKRRRPPPPPAWDLTTVTAGATHVVAAATRDGHLFTWRLPGTQPVATLVSEQAPQALTLSPDGAELLGIFAAGFASELRTYELASGRAVRSRPVPGDDVVLARHATHVACGSRTGGELAFERLDGTSVWPSAPAEPELGAAALSHGLAVEYETRSGVDTVQHVTAFYRGLVREFAAPGYYGDLLALSPSGAHVAAIVAREGRSWDVTTGAEHLLPIPDAAGFPDGLAFADESLLRVIFERPAATYTAALPFTGDWRPELAPGALDGFQGTAVSSGGAVITNESGKLVAARTGRVLVPEGGGGFAFSGDGAVAFAGAPQRLAWFEPDGAPRGEQALTCTPGALAADYRGHHVAFECGGRLSLLERDGNTARVRTASFGAERSAVSAGLLVSPSGHLVVVVEKAGLTFVRAADLTVVATLTLPGGTALVRGAQGSVWLAADAPPEEPTWACRVGHRAVPFAACRDRLTDDTLLDALLE